MATDVIYIFRNVDKSDLTPPASPSALLLDSTQYNPSPVVATKREPKTTDAQVKIKTPPAKPPKSAATPASATKYVYHLSDSIKCLPTQTCVFTENE
jgi:hypothetical protein